MRKLNLSIEQEQSIVDSYISGLNFEKVSKKYRISTWKVEQLLNKYNIKSRKNKDLRKQFFCNSDYFKVIDSKDKAYFLGLLYADGWNDETISNVGIQIKACDIKVLLLLKNSIEYTGNIIDIFRTRYISTHSDLKRLVIKDMILSKDLAKLGCVKNKTFIINKIPEEVSEELLNHFIRGYFDGDGSIHNDTTTDNLKYQIVGNEELLKDITKVLIKHCNVNNNKIHGKIKTKSISFGGNIVCKRIYDWMYLNCGDFYMDRKREIFLNKWKTYYQ
jgi:intein/homing endonuclease